MNLNCRTLELRKLTPVLKEEGNSRHTAAYVSGLKTDYSHNLSRYPFSR